MPQTITPEHKDYDPRWFIWTIVFLVVAGVSLVSYIMLSNNGVTINPVVPARADHQGSTTPTTQIAK